MTINLGKGGNTLLLGYKVAAVCTSKIHEDTTRAFIESLRLKLESHGWRVFVYTSSSDLYWKTQFNAGEKAIFDLVNFDTMDALIICKEKILDPDVVAHLLDSAKAKNIPALVIDGDEEGCCNIKFDYVKGFELVVRHLAEEHQVRSFHYLAGLKDNHFSDSRRVAMERVLTEYGIPFDESMVSYGNFWSEPSQLATEKLISENRLPRAIVCANDTMALAVCSTLLQHGYRIPEDVIVTGFDGIDAIRFSAPRITSCQCDFYELGTKTAEMLLLSETGQPLPRYVHVLPRLILMESCGCVSHETVDRVNFLNTLSDEFTRFRNEDENLSEISVFIQTCPNNQEVTKKLHTRLFYNMSTLLKPECVDFTLNPQTMHSDTTFSDRMYVLSDSDMADGFESYEISTAELTPRLEFYLKRGAPLVFIGLHTFDVPIGYLCFHYNDTDKQNYLKISQIASALDSAIGGYRNLQYQQHLQNMIEEMYKYDSLTGLHNRNGFLRKYQYMIQHQTLGDITIVLCDLDGLKYINDNFSHREGDNAISVVADALHSACYDGLCSRYGGDELIAVLTKPCNPDAIRQKIKDYLTSYNRTSNKPYAVSASIGIYTTKDTDFDRMFTNVDKLMYQDKMNKPHTRK